MSEDLKHEIEKIIKITVRGMFEDAEYDFTDYEKMQFVVAICKAFVENASSVPTDVPNGLPEVLEQMFRKALGETVRKIVREEIEAINKEQKEKVAASVHGAKSRSVKV